MFAGKKGTEWGWTSNDVRDTPQIEFGEHISAMRSEKQVRGQLP